MKTIQQYLTASSLRFIDHTEHGRILGEPNRALTSFAIDDAIATMVGNGESLPTVRLWTHPPTLVLGIPDSRLPYIDEGVQFMKALHHQVLIRNSGGLAVLLDHGVLNMSLIIPNDGELSIHDGYDMMYHFIQQLFETHTSKIKAYEIVGSYCPGDYDLSINGIKFAGISQRRVRKGVAIQIYLDIEGSSLTRVSLVRDFYQISTKGEPTKHTYPTIHPEVMGTISQLTDHPFTVHDVCKEIKNVCHKHLPVTMDNLSDKEAVLFQQRLKQMMKRNERLA